MNRSLFKPKFFFSLALCAALAGGAAQAQPAKDYQPEVGQAGKDVVWVPTPQALVDKMLDMAKLTPQDYLIDLGSGDGRTVITAAKRGARAHGIEYNPDMVDLSKRNATKEGVAEISGDMTVLELENLFMNRFGLAAQVFRKSGNIWLETIRTDNWTLKQQNNHGMEISEDEHFREENDYDLSRDAGN